MQHQVEARRPRPRIETLADLIFGLSLSIGSIALIANSATSPEEIGSHIFAFTFTFLFLITAWLIYTNFMSVLPLETESITFLNIALLLLVALVPYLLNNVELTNPSLNLQEALKIKDFSSTLFALDFAGILVILASFAHVLSVEEKKLVAPELVTLFRNGRNRMSILAVVMAVTVAPQFWQLSLLGVPLRIYMWYIPLISYWAGRAIRPESRTYKVS